MHRGGKPKRNASRKEPAISAGFFVAASFVTSLWLPAVGAQVRASSDYLQRMDSSRDGRVSLVEYQAWMGYAFERMDRDGDGILSPAELPGGRGKSVSLVAHRESLAAAFRRQDANRDGVLDARELAAPPQ